MLLFIFQKYIITCVALEFGAGESTADAPGEAFSAAAVVFEKAGFPIGSGVRLEGEGGDQAADSAAAAFFGYQHVVETETAQPCCKSNVAVGPVAEKYFGVEIMGGGGCVSGVAVVFKEPPQMLAEVLNQFIGIDVGFRPFGRGQAAGEVACDD